MLISLSLGLTAALLWGLHDYIVRLIGDRADARAMLLVALVIGAVLLAPLALMADGWDRFGAFTLGMTALSGFFYALGAYGLYRAFAIGPVRLVAPICGAYPLLSVAFHMARGGAAGLAVWAGVIAVIVGITLVTRGEAEEAQAGKLTAIAWSLLAGFGFAFTFGFSQWAAETAGELPVVWVARLCACLTAAFVALVWKVPFLTVRPIWKALSIMGTLDAVALTLVTLAGHFPHPEYAPVTASLFGIVTIILAWRLLGEAMVPLQWIGIVVTFGGIALLTLA
jgi:drug/metabolite transporter (DMT)-like permease